MEYELEKLVENMATKTIKSFETEIKELKIRVNELVEGQNFTSDKHDIMANEHKNALTKSKKQKEEIEKQSKCTEKVQKKVIAKNLN